MKFKSLILGTAATFAVVGGAQAADLAVAEPVEYVRICDAFGTGFFYIPGSDACLKIGARVRVGGSFDPDIGRGWDWYTKGYINVVSKWSTEMGDAVLFVEMEGKHEGGGGVALGDVYGKLGGWLFGKTGSVANLPGGYTDAGGFRNDHSAIQISYAGEFGGFGWALGIEDGTHLTVAGVDTWGTLPDLTLRVSGSAGGITGKVTAAVVDRTFGTGYGVGGNLEGDMGGILGMVGVAWSHDLPDFVGGANGVAPEGDMISALASVKIPVGPAAFVATATWIDNGAAPDTTKGIIGIQADVARNISAFVEGWVSDTGGVQDWSVYWRLQWKAPGT